MGFYIRLFIALICFSCINNKVGAAQEAQEEYELRQALEASQQAQEEHERKRASQPKISKAEALAKIFHAIGAIFEKYYTKPRDWVEWEARLFGKQIEDDYYKLGELRDQAAALNRYAGDFIVAWFEEFNNRGKNNNDRRVNGSRLYLGNATADVASDLFSEKVSFTPDEVSKIEERYAQLMGRLGFQTTATEDNAFKKQLRKLMKARRATIKNIPTAPPAPVPDILYQPLVPTTASATSAPSRTAGSGTTVPTSSTAGSGSTMQ